MPTANRLDVFRACLVVFVASCATLVLELVANRILAPYVGVTLQTWSSIIGVVLLGISLGAWVGGRLADQEAWLERLGPIVAAGAVTAALPLVVPWALGETTALRVVPILPRTLLLSLIIFFPVSFTLSLVTPLALRRLLGDLARAGRVTGLIYALGTVGALAGNYLTGFVLVAWYPTPTIVLWVMGALAVCAAIAWPKSRAAPGAVAATATPAAEVVVQPVDRFDLRGNLPLACAVVAFSSFCTLLIEVGASRMLAPTWGVSLFSWTGIIGVVLLGMAAGNYLGGQLADRSPRQETLAASLVAAAAACLLVLPINRALTQADALEGPSLMRSIVLHTALVFLIPITALGTLSPQVLRLSLTGLASAGRTVGLLYAVSTAGALLGSFLTGWVLISVFGVNALVFASGAGLLLLGATLGRVWRRPRFLGAVGAAGVLAVGTLGLGFAKSPCTEETGYFCIKVFPAMFQGHEHMTMQLDRLHHTLTRLDDPSALGYPHDYIQSEFVREVVTRNPAPRVLIIGGGGYVFPRWIEHFIPAAKVDVVEIDPEVTRLALKHFGVRPDTKIRSFNLDGRQFVTELADRSAYDLVVQDAVNDLSVPYHLLTREYVEQVKAILTSQGIFLVSVIDDIPHGALLRAEIRTVQAVFPHVAVVYDIGSGGQGQTIYMAVGSMQPIDIEKVRQAAKDAGIAAPRTAALTESAIAAYLDAGPKVLLTDAWAPVDNMLADLFLLRQELTTKQAGGEKR